MGDYVIVIARGQGFMAVNEPSPRAKPEDKVCLRCHIVSPRIRNSDQSGGIYNSYSTGCQGFMAT